MSTDLATDLLPSLKDEKVVADSRQCFYPCSTLESKGSFSVVATVDESVKWKFEPEHLHQVYQLV